MVSKYRRIERGVQSKLVTHPSILGCVLTFSQGGLPFYEWYLHGREPLLSLPRLVSDALLLGITIVALVEGALRTTDGGGEYVFLGGGFVQR